MRHLDLSKASPQLREALVRRFGEQRKLHKAALAYRRKAAKKPAKYRRASLTNDQLGSLLEYRKAYLAPSEAYASVDPKNPNFREVDADESRFLDVAELRRDNQQFSKALSEEFPDVTEEKAEAIKQIAKDEGCSWDEAKRIFEEGPSPSLGKYAKGKQWDEAFQRYCRKEKMMGQHDRAKRMFQRRYGDRPAN